PPFTEIALPLIRDWPTLLATSRHFTPLWRLRS
ncbi:uncharacterized protein METZ01_LOCUS330384, partial [marine metagenome]